MPRRCTAARLHSVGIDLRIFRTFARHFEDIHRSVIRPAERAPHRRTADVRCRIRYECTHGSYLRCRQMPPRVMMKSSAFGQHGQTEFRTLFCAAGFLSRRAYSPHSADLAAYPHTAVPQPRALFTSCPAAVISVHGFRRILSPCVLQKIKSRLSEKESRDFFICQG